MVWPSEKRSEWTSVLHYTYICCLVNHYIINFGHNLCESWGSLTCSGTIVHVCLESTQLKYSVPEVLHGLPISLEKFHVYIRKFSCSRIWRLDVNVRLVILWICVHSVMKYGIILVVAGLAAKRYTLNKRWLLELRWVQNVEIHVESSLRCYRFCLFHVNTHFH